MARVLKDGFGPGSCFLGIIRKGEDGEGAVERDADFSPHGPRMKCLSWALAGSKAQSSCSPLVLLHLIFLRGSIKHRVSPGETSVLEPPVRAVLLQPLSPAHRSSVPCLKINLTSIPLPALLLEGLARARIVFQARLPQLTPELFI